MNPRRPRGSHRSYDPLSHLVFLRSQGEYVWDEQGRKYLDLICGYSACNLGHAHPRLTAAVCEQISEQTWAHGGQSQLRSRLEETLGSLWDQNTPPGRKPHRYSKVWLTVSGARAIEIAWKLAYAKRPGSTIGFDLAYHGRSLASALLSDTERSEAFGPHGSLENHATIPFPRHLHGLCAPILMPDACNDASSNPQEAHAEKSPLCAECQRALEQASQTFEKLKSRASILFVEPAIGARGYYFAPAAFMQRLVALARNYDLAIVSDEIQMGLRRTGPMFLCRGQAWEPDLLVLGKSLGGGILPIAAVVGPDDWIDGIGPGIESETFAAYPMACRLALETLEILQTPNLRSDIERKGDFFRSLLSTHLPEPLVTLGSGLACCVSFENLPNSGSELAFQVVKKLADQGVLIHLTGPKRNRIAAIPSLLIQESSLEMAARSILRAIEES